MTTQTTESRILLGDEAVALAALDAGITAAYAYPGTPSTEIFEFLEEQAPARGVTAHWCANEKTAYEQALGVSMAGRRTLVSMKHVGLNVAADAFINSAIVRIGGGLVVAVADDPGMHSSQNEQDSRVLADFARVPCLEPSDQQEAYEMTREAFDLSERFHVPVLVRLVTRLCHGRARVETTPPVGQNALHEAHDPTGWTLLPAISRGLWRELLDLQPALGQAAASSGRITLEWNDGGTTGVVTTGIARTYFGENAPDLPLLPPHLHIGAYPGAEPALREMAERVDRILVLEDGYPFIEDRLRGILPHRWEIGGRRDGTLPLDGELTPDTVRTALGLPARERIVLAGIDLPTRPPQLCTGCPHRDSYTALGLALADIDTSVVASDIGCYTLGALAPYEAIESCVCMGASIGMAKGASDAGVRPALAVIGDSTFLHSGVTGLIDAVAADTDLTILVLDNGTVAMTGLQPTALTHRLRPIAEGIGVSPDHVRIVDIGPRAVEELAAVLREEMAHPGVSVVVAVRECVEAAKARRRSARSRGTS
jgi:indolepyruvate ferredoxin oxidoreductase alpha subunit